MTYVVLALIASVCLLFGYRLARTLWMRPHDPLAAMRRIWLGGLLDGIAVSCIAAAGAVAVL